MLGEPDSSAVWEYRISHYFEGEPFPDQSAPKTLHFCDDRCVSNAPERPIGHDIECEGTPCRCEERERQARQWDADWLAEDARFERSQDV